MKAPTFYEMPGLQVLNENFAGIEGWTPWTYSDLGATQESVDSRSKMISNVVLRLNEIIGNHALSQDLISNYTHDPISQWKITREKERHRQ